jgi:1,4-dihydroxy-2-naphthoate octaprenyltransferase
VIIVDLKIWFMETRPQFLLLAPITFSVGLATAYADGYFDLLPAIIGIVGVVLAHASVNVLNDYFDFRSGLDLKTQRTPFSGGSGVIVKGLLSARAVFLFGLSCLIATIMIGVYFSLTKGLIILPIVAIASLSIYFYTTHLSHRLLGEFFAGLNFGPLMVLGSYFTQTGVLSIRAFAIGLIPGLLVANLLLLNEFPDVEADKFAGRINSVIRFGLRRSSLIYTGLVVSCFLFVLVSVFVGFMPLTALLFFLTAPIAFRAVQGVLRSYGEINSIIPAMGLNVQLVLLGTASLALGLAVSKII